MLKIVSSFFCFILLLPSTSFAQEKKTINPYLDYNVSLKMNVGLAKRRLAKHDVSWFFNPMFQWRNRHFNFHEIGLNFGSITGGSGSGSGCLALRYEFVYTFMKHFESRLVPALGIGVAPFVNWHYKRPFYTNEYPQSQVVIGSRFSVVPRLTYYFSKKLYVDVATPINFLKADVTMKREPNPGLKPDKQRSNIWHLGTTLNGSGIRFGIGLKF